MIDHYDVTRLVQMYDVFRTSDVYIVLNEVVRHDHPIISPNEDSHQSDSVGKYIDHNNKMSDNCSYLLITNLQ